MPYAEAIAAAAVALHTLYSPASGNSKSAHALAVVQHGPRSSRRLERRFVIRHVEPSR